MELIQAVQTTAEPETYVTHGCLTSNQSSIALSLSSNVIRVYDARTTAFQYELRDHNDLITDLVTSPGQPHLLFSAQEDGGVMITDSRQARAAHFITDACRTGVVCSSITVSPSGDALMVAKTGDMDVYDPRTWTPMRCIDQMHWEEITRLRYVDDRIVCSAGEDLMINHIDTSASTSEDDILLQATNCGEVITRMNCFSEVAQVGLIGSCENAYLYPYELERTEQKIERPDFSTYMVDWVMVDGQLMLVSGVRNEDGDAGPITVVQTAPDAAVTPADPLLREVIPLPKVHRQLVRIALGLGDRLLTGGEDGVLAWWRRGASGAGVGSARKELWRGEGRGGARYPGRGRGAGVELPRPGQTHRHRDK